ncbi:MAG: restriction endonuclease subunit S [Deltaproteobacteria bacterium]|nr:restriction endonuclease subunit S [Deltaproteobacteria bacterium]
MDVKPGYKQTEVGVIPEDWKVKQIKDMKPYVTSGSRGWASYYSDQGSPFIRITNLNRASIYMDLEDLRFVNLPANNSEAMRTQLQDGDILISITADIGIVGNVSSKLPKPAYINQHIALVRFDPAQTSSRFVSYFLASEKPQRLFRALTDSGAKAGMNLTTVQQIRVNLPPTKAEQEAIAGALSDADALIESLEQLIVKKRQIKQGAMQELLTGKKRLPGFEVKSGYKQTEAGLIPEDWELDSLEHLSAFITKGSTPTTYGFKWETHGVLFLRSECVSDNGLDLNQSMYISPEAHSVLRRSQVCDGDILITITGNVGRVVFLYGIGTANLNQHIARVRMNATHVNAHYVYHFLSQRSVRRRFASITTGQAYPQISLKQVRDAKVPRPPTKTEQTAIASILSDMDAEISTLEEKLAKARQIKQGMMQELLTGRIRLV